MVIGVHTDTQCQWIYLCSSPHAVLLLVVVVLSISSHPVINVSASRLANQRNHIYLLWCQIRLTLNDLMDSHRQRRCCSENQMMFSNDLYFNRILSLCQRCVGRYNFLQNVIWLLLTHKLLHSIFTESETLYVNISVVVIGSLCDEVSGWMCALVAIHEAPLYL